MYCDFTAAVYKIVSLIPKGKVATYGQIALMAGRPRAARIVGGMVAKVPKAMLLPCYRVVYKDGKLCGGDIFGGEGMQRQMLEAEGVSFLSEQHVNLSNHLWDGAI